MTDANEPLGESSGDPSDPSAPSVAGGHPTDAPGPGGPRGDLLAWPPPGLSRIQGDLGVAARKMTVAGTVLVLPLVGVLALPHSPYGLGPLGNAWWIVLLTTLVGVVLFADAAQTVIRMLMRVKRAVGRGYSMHVVGLVLSDADRTNGHVLQGAHAFSEMSESERSTVARLQLWSLLSYLAASTWLVVAFGMLLLVAARGGTSLTGVLLGTLAPTALLGVAGLGLASATGVLKRRARKAWFEQPWASDLAEQEISSWREAGVERGVPATDSTGSPAWLTPVTIGLIVLSLIAVFPALTLVPASSMGAILGSIATSSWVGYQRRLAEAEAYRGSVLEPDPSISAAEAGEILHVIAMVASEEGDRESPIREPVRVYDERWTPPNDLEAFAPGDPRSWSEIAWEWADRGLTPDERTFLEESAEHPAREEFSRLARAGEIDAIGGRYELPFSEDLTYFELPWIRWTTVRSAADTHIAQAVLHSADGRHEDAQRVAREVVSVGVLLMDQSITLIGNLYGARLATQGGQALANAMRRAGNVEGARLLAARAEGAELAAERIREPYGRSVWLTQANLLEMPEVVLDTEQPLGLRWEFAHLTPLVTACLNLRRVVFGPGGEHEEWVASARESLVDSPSDAAFFDLAMSGMTPFGEPALLGRVLALSMGGADEPASCGHVVAHLPGSM